MQPLVTNSLFNKLKNRRPSRHLQSVRVITHDHLLGYFFDFISREYRNKRLMGGTAGVLLALVEHVPPIYLGCVICLIYNNRDSRIYLDQSGDDHPR